MKLAVSLIACIILVFTSSCGQMQNNSSDKQAVKMLKDFYTNYITVFATVPAGTNSQIKFNSLQRQYCTESLLKKILALGPLDSDPFLKAQDSNIEYLKTLSVIKDSTKANTYIVSYMDNFIKPDRSIKEQVVIHLIVVKEKEDFKIDSVW